MSRDFKHDYKQGYNLDIRPGESDLSYYRRLAKVADQRLVRLEKLKNEPHFENVDKYAYARAMRDIESYGGGKRFNVKPPEDRREFNEKISDMIRFIQSPTSTKKGIVDVYKKRADTINQKYKDEGLNLTWQQLADMFDSGQFDKISSQYGSDTIFVAIGKVQKSGKQIKQALKGNKKIKGSPEDQAVKDIVKNKELLNIITK